MKMMNVDPLLQLLASTEGTLLTLYVKGNVITGETINSSTYARRLGNPGGVKPAPFESLAVKYEETEAAHEELASRADELSKKDEKAMRKLARRFITLKGARYMTGSSGFQPKDGFDVRVRLDSVDGWNWGELRSSIA